MLIFNINTTNTQGWFQSIRKQLFRSKKVSVRIGNLATCISFMLETCPLDSRLMPNHLQTQIQ